MVIDLRDEIEDFCVSCRKINLHTCKGCFFSSVNMGRVDLGGQAVYAKAFRYLKRFGTMGILRKVAIA